MIVQRFLLNLLYTHVAVLVVRLAFVAICGGPDHWSLTPMSAILLYVTVTDGSLPLVLLVATLFTVDPLVHRSEVTAMCAAGLSFLWMIRPLLSAAGVLVLGGVAVRLLGLIGAPAEPVGTVSGSTMVYAFWGAPLFCLVSVLLGGACAALPRRKGKYGSFGLALLLSLGLRLIDALAVSLGRAGALSPVIAGLAGVATAMGFASAMFYRVR